MNIWAILPAAGIGRRMGSSTPKQYHDINGTPVLIHSINRLLEISALKKLVVVLHPEDSHWQKIEFNNSKVVTVEGGAERANSVLNGLDYLAGQAQPDDWVLVHDAVRPCVNANDINALLDKLIEDPVGGILGAPIDNTVKKVNSSEKILTTVDRSDLWSALTPQMFRFKLLQEALQRINQSEFAFTDESSAVEALGYTPKVVLGSKKNIKITHGDDLKLAQYYFSNEEG